MGVNKQVVGCICRAGIYRAANCKNHLKIEGKIIFFKENDVTANVAQRKSNRIKSYASAFSNN